MNSRSRKLTALFFAAALMLGGCSDNSKDKSSADEQSGHTSSVSDSENVSSAVSEDYLLYPAIVKTKEEAKKKLCERMWMYMDGTKIGKLPEEYIPYADKDAWYYGSYLNLKEDGNGLVTIGGYDSTLTYTVNDDLTIDITHGNPEMTYQFMLGEDEEYGEILYSTEDENIRYYHEKFDGSTDRRNSKANSD